MAKERITKRTNTHNLVDVDFSGEWIGSYENGYDQVIKIEQYGHEIVATKVTGDSYVPGGEITFRANIKTRAGEGQIAAEEFRDPSFVAGRLYIHGPERISFVWSNRWKAHFRKDD